MRLIAILTGALTCILAAAAPHSYRQASTINPCLAVRNIVSNPNGTLSVARVPAQLAYDCLNNVPLDSEAAGPWLNSLRPYLEWQTTTSYLKNPPQGYLEPAIDIRAEFEDIVQRATNGKFSNEYELELTLYRLFQRTHDGHFRYLPNMIGGIFLFGRPLSLVSYSADGSCLPKPYVYTDVLSHFANGAGEPSAVLTIDGQDAVTFLQNWSQYGSLQDPDALYNNVFFELAQTALGSTGSGPGTFAGAGRGAYIYPGPTTTLQFENGTTVIYENFARVLVPFTGIENGTALYRRYINTISSATATTADVTDGVTDSAAAAMTPRPGYPAPVQIQANNFVAGYYLNETGYEDVAVLAVTSFINEPDYQNVAYNFISGAAAANKTKLVIDLSANGGGTIVQGYSLFLNLFPDILPYGATRFRAHEAFDLIGETASQRIPYYPFNYTNPPNSVWQDFGGGTPFNYRADVDINYQNFPSWPAKYGPHTFNGDNFTSIIRWNLSDPTIAPANGVQPNNFGSRAGLPPARLFKPENIVILYDGYCASTCTIFSELMTNQAGVKTIAIGGRPRDNTPMAAVGGVEGTNNYPWTFINQLVRDTYALAPDQASFLNTTVLREYVGTEAVLPFARAVSGSAQVNSRDNIRYGDNTETPLQFVYDAADCRLFYTAEMTVDVTAIWEKVVDVSWKGDSCVFGGISSKNHARSTRGAGEQKARERLSKRMFAVSEERVRELEEAQHLWTDLSTMRQDGHGFMTP